MLSAKQEETSSDLQRRVSATPFSVSKRHQIGSGSPKRSPRNVAPIEVGEDQVGGLSAIQQLTQPPPRCPPNPYWQQPPPTFDPVPDHLNPQPELRRDQWHRLLATDTAARSEVQQHQEEWRERMQSGAADKLPPVGGKSAAGMSRADSVGQQGGYTPTLTQTAALSLNSALFTDLPSHTVPGNALRSANNPRKASTKGIQFKPSAQGNSNKMNKTFNNLQNILVPPSPAFRNLSSDARFILQGMGGKVRAKLENHLMSESLVVQPEPRPLPPEEELVEEEEWEEGEEEEESEGSIGSDVTPKKKRRRRKKQMIGNEMGQTDPAFDLQSSMKTTPSPAPQSPPPAIQTHTQGKNAPAVRYNALTGEVEVIQQEEEGEGSDIGADDEEVSDPEDATKFDMGEALGWHSTLNAWNSCVQRKREEDAARRAGAGGGMTWFPTGERKPISKASVPDPAHDEEEGPQMMVEIDASSPEVPIVCEVTGRHSAKIFTPQVTSVYNTDTRRPAVQQYLCGPRGIRVGAFHKTSTEEPEAFVMKDYDFQNLIAERGAQIEEMQLEGMRWLKEECFFTIGEFCPHLRMLNLAGCTQLTVAALTKIAVSCNLLSYLNVSDCPNLTCGSLGVVMSCCSNLDVFCAHAIGYDPNATQQSNQQATSQPTAQGSTLASTTNPSHALSGAMSGMSSTFAQSLTAPTLMPLGTSVALGDSILSDGGIDPLGNPAAVRAALESCPFPMLYRCRHLRVMDVSYCPAVNDGALVSIAQCCPGISILNISGCKGFGDVGFTALGSLCSNLKAVSLQLCDQPRLTPQGLTSLAVGPRNLESLDLTGVAQLTDEALSVILRQSACLKQLNLNGCWQITDASIQMLNSHCTHIRCVEIAACDRVSLQILLDLIHDIPNLLKLVVSDRCSDAEIAMLLEVRGNLKIVKNKFRSNTSGLGILVGYKPEIPKPKPETTTKKRR